MTPDPESAHRRIAAVHCPHCKARLNVGNVSHAYKPNGQDWWICCECCGELEINSEIYHQIYLAPLPPELEIAYKSAPEIDAYIARRGSGQEEIF